MTIFPSNSNKVLLALKFAIKKHRGQLRKGKVNGRAVSYVIHPIRVARILRARGFGEDYIIVALLHDTIEDTDTTYEEILELFGRRIADAVMLLSKRKGYVLDEYLGNINRDEIARNVKVADRLDNLGDASSVSKKFLIGYLKNTEEYFPPLARETVFEQDLKDLIERVGRRLRDGNTE